VLPFNITKIKRSAIITNKNTAKNQKAAALL